MSLLQSGWGAGTRGIWEYKVSGDHQIVYSSLEAIERQRALGYDTSARIDLRTNVQHSIIQVRPLGETEWGWSSGYRHRAEELV